MQGSKLCLTAIHRPTDTALHVSFRLRQSEPIGWCHHPLYQHLPDHLPCGCRHRAGIKSPRERSGKFILPSSVRPLPGATARRSSITRATHPWMHCASPGVASLMTLMHWRWPSHCLVKCPAAWGSSCVRVPLSSSINA